MILPFLFQIISSMLPVEVTSTSLSSEERVTDIFTGRFFIVHSLRKEDFLPL